MSDSRLTLKHPTGFFAAGCEMREALTLLSDGAFKRYAYLCLYADRRTAQLRFRVPELARATGHSARSLTTYLEELRRHQVGVINRAANQHEPGCIEICDHFWPYEKQASASTEDPEQALYVARVRGWFLEPACVVSVFSPADEKLALQWYRAGAALDQVHRAILMGCARKYVALFNNWWITHYRLTVLLRDYGRGRQDRGVLGLLAVSGDESGQAQPPMACSRKFCGTNARSATKNELMLPVSLPFP